MPVRCRAKAARARRPGGGRPFKVGSSRSYGAAVKGGGQGKRRMDIYQAFFTLKPGVSDMAFADALESWMAHLKARDLIAGHRLLRRKLGLAPDTWGEFQLLVEVRDLSQLDAAFDRVAAREAPEEEIHFAVNRCIGDVSFGLYRDFPDPQRQRGGRTLLNLPSVAPREQWGGCRRGRSRNRSRLHRVPSPRSGSARGLRVHRSPWGGRRRRRACRSRPVARRRRPVDPYRWVYRACAGPCCRHGQAWV